MEIKIKSIVDLKIISMFSFDKIMYIPRFLGWSAALRQSLAASGKS